MRVYCKKTAWEDTDFKSVLDLIDCEPDEKIDSADALCEAMKEKTTLSTNTIRITYIVSAYIREKKVKTQLQLAQEIEVEGSGPFAGHDKATAQELKNRIVDYLMEKAPGMSKDEATAIIVEMLEQRQLEYVWHLTIPQLTGLVYKHVTEWNTLRPKHIKDMITAHRESQQYPPSSPEYVLHDQEKNAIMNSMDVLIKLKGSLNQTLSLLMNGTAIHLHLHDEEYEAESMLDIYLVVSVVYCFAAK